MSTFFQEGRKLVVRAQWMELFDKVGYPEDLVGLLSLSRVGGSSLDLYHELRRAKDQALLAKGVVTAVYLSEKGTPHPVPDSYRRLVVPEKAAVFPEVLRAPLERYRQALMSRTLSESLTLSRHRVRIDPSRIDLFHHMNHAQYLALLEDQRRSALGTAAPNLKRVYLEYNRDVFAGQSLEVLRGGVEGSPSQELYALYHAERPEAVSVAVLELAAADDASGHDVAASTLLGEEGRSTDA